MNKIETIRKKYNDAQASKDTLKADVSKLSERQQVLDAEAQKLAENGDTDGYMVKKAEADRAAAELYVKQVQLEKTDNPITEAEVKEAWKEYVKGADKELQAAWIEYKKKRTALFTQMQKCMNLMQNSFVIREELYNYIVGDLWLAKQEARRNLHMFTIENRDVINDIEMYKRNGKITPETATQYTILTNGHYSSL